MQNAKRTPARIGKAFATSPVGHMPPRIAKLRRDARGYPVPAFVAWVHGADGKPLPDFRAIKPGYVLRCIQERRCWICGQHLVEKRAAYVIGPMCMANRISAEPPSHEACARFAATECPFLNTPKRKRNPAGPLDLEAEAAPLKPGAHSRNPGCAVVWTVALDGMGTFYTDIGLFKIGDPVRIEIYANGRKATIEESREALEAGLAILRKEAADEGPGAFASFADNATTARQLVERAYGADAIGAAEPAAAAAE